LKLMFSLSFYYICCSKTSQIPYSEILYSVAPNSHCYEESFVQTITSSRYLDIQSCDLIRSPIHQGLGWTARQTTAAPEQSQGSSAAPTQDVALPFSLRAR
ncbi:unnamed protein product, partial [Bubo scandiacus]